MDRKFSFRFQPYIVFKKFKKKSYSTEYSIKKIEGKTVPSTQQSMFRVYFLPLIVDDHSILFLTLL
jgi:hypothetical protein